jgi:hypothetical protein
MEAGPDMKFCRRCGTTMSRQNGHVYICTNGHTIYANASPAVALILENDSGEIAVLERAKDPGKAAKLTANDDAASAQFMHKTQLKHTDLFFPSLQTGFKRFISQ